MGYEATVKMLDLAATALLVVDVYGSGFDRGDPIPEWPTMFLQRVHLLQVGIMNDCIRPAIDAARAISMPVIYVENRWQPRVWGGSSFAEVTEQAECGRIGRFDETYAQPHSIVYSDIVRPLAGDIVVQKAMYDGFFETNLDSVLRNRGIRELVCVGFTADICLLTTALGAMYRNFRLTLLRDATIGAEFVDTVDEMSVTNGAIRYFEALVGHTALTADFIAAAASIERGDRAPVAAATER